MRPLFCRQLPAAHPHRTVPLSPFPSSPHISFHPPRMIACPRSLHSAHNRPPTPPHRLPGLLPQEPRLGRGLPMQQPDIPNPSLSTLHFRLCSSGHCSGSQITWSQHLHSHRGELPPHTLTWSTSVGSAPFLSNSFTHLMHPQEAATCSGVRSSDDLHENCVRSGINGAGSQQIILFQHTAGPLPHCTLIHLLHKTGWKGSVTVQHWGRCGTVLVGMGLSLYNIWNSTGGDRSVTV